MTAPSTLSLRPQTDLVDRLARPTEDELAGLDAWWRANNYLTVGQIYLQANPLLREPLRPEHIKPRLLGHWGTVPGLSFIYAHCIAAHPRDRPEMIYLAGPGPRRPRARRHRLPRGHLHARSTPRSPGRRRPAPAVPPVLGARRDPEPRVACTTPGLDPRGRRARLRARPRLRRRLRQPRPDRARRRRRRRGRDRPARGLLEGRLVPQPGARRRRAADPAPQRLQDRRPDRARPQGPGRGRARCSTGHGYEVIGSRATSLPGMHQRFAAALDRGLDRIRDDPGRRARAAAGTARGPRWPAIVLRTPKGWTGPDVVDGVQVEGTFRAHQVPLAGVRSNPEHLRMLEAWMRCYRPEELFDADGRTAGSSQRANPSGDLRMSATPHANGGRSPRARPAGLPRLRASTCRRRRPCARESTRALGELMRDVYRAQPRPTFRLFCPDETNSQPPRRGLRGRRTAASWSASLADDDHVSHDGRVMEVLSEHNCHGWLEGYTLTGPARPVRDLRGVRDGDRVDDDPARKWLEEAAQLPWRAAGAVAELPADLDLLAQRPQRLQPPGPGPHPERHLQAAATSSRVYLPPDANCLLSVADHCLRSRELREPRRHRQAAAAAVADHGRGARALRARRRRSGTGPAPTTARRPRHRARLRRRHRRRWRRSRPPRSCASTLPHLRVRVVNVVDLMTLPAAARTTRTAWTRRASTRCSPTTSTSSSPSTATPARSTSWSTAARTPTASTCAASSRRARRRRRSTWSCSTG